MKTTQPKPPTKESPIETEQMTSVVVQAMVEKKAAAVRILDGAELLAYTDRFILCSGASPRQVRAIAEHVMMVMKKDHNILPIGVEGRGTDQWVLVDFGIVVIHVFTHDSRQYYALDDLWLDAPQISVADLGIEDDAALASPQSTPHL
jgi:ribosome-associated protein